MSFDGNRNLLVVLESGEHGLTETQGEDGNEFTEAFGMAEVDGWRSFSSGTILVAEAVRQTYKSLQAEN